MLAGSRDIPLMRSGFWQVRTWQLSWASSLFLTGLEACLHAGWLFPPNLVNSQVWHFTSCSGSQTFFFFLTYKLQFQISDNLRLSQGFRKFSNLNNYQFHPPSQSSVSNKNKIQYVPKFLNCHNFGQNIYAKNNNCRRGRQPIPTLKKKKVHAYFYCYTWVCVFRGKRGRVLIPAVTGNQSFWPLSLAEGPTGELDARLQRRYCFGRCQQRLIRHFVSSPGDQKCLFFYRPAKPKNN